jgi:hypothetical protein
LNRVVKAPKVLLFGALLLKKGAWSIRIIYLKSTLFGVKMGKNSHFLRLKKF